MASGALMFEEEPHGTWLTEDFDRLCLWAADVGGISDIMLYSGHPAVVRCDGRWVRVSRRALTNSSILPVIDDISRSNTSSAMLSSGRYLDFVHIIRHARGEQRRYRCSAIACREFTGGNSGANLVLRIIPEVPPTLENLEIENEIVECCRPKNGLVLVTGTMGNGKTTLVAAIMRAILENETRYIATFEDPIEFNLLNIPNIRGICTQSEIGAHLESFAEAPRTAARHAVDVLYVGESRDTATMMGALNLADMGMAVYTTVHSQNVAQTPQRMINIFPHAERDNVASTIVNNVRLIIQQRLLPKVGGGRIAIREYLNITESHKEELRRLPYEKLLPALQRMVEEDGLTLEKAARKKLNEGLITDTSYNLIRLESYNKE